tara:strand:+ start:3655 stop:4311 length:657 start_codon:yes stop_codon:yes gene_type:complete
MGFYDLLNTINRSELEEKVKQSKSFNSLLKSFGENNGGYIRMLRYKIKKEQIDTSHFTTSSAKKRYTNKEVFVENSTYNDNNCIKKRLMEFNLIPNECYRCKIKGGKTNFPEIEGFCNILILQLDHINGINRDNRLENLRLLCPNCHSQTKTFCGKNKKHKPKNKCLVCNKEIRKTSKRCIDCCRKEYSNNKCIDCEKKIRKKSKRCIDCHKNFRKKR